MNDLNDHFLASWKQPNPNGGGPNETKPQDMKQVTDWEMIGLLLSWLYFDLHE